MKSEGIKAEVFLPLFLGVCAKRGMGWLAECAPLEMQFELMVKALGDHSKGINEDIARGGERDEQSKEGK